MHYFRRELTYNLKRFTFYLSVFLVLFCFYFEHRDYFWDNVWKKIDVFYMFFLPYEDSLFFMLMPFAAVLPGALHIVDDLKTGSIRLQCYRGSKRKLIFAKLAACNISAMLAVFAGCVIFLIFSLCVAPVLGDVGEAWIQQTNGRSYEYLAHTAQGLPFIGEIILRTILTAWLWSQIGCLFSLAFENKAITLTASFILFYGLDYLFMFIRMDAWRPFSMFYSGIEYNGSIAFRYVQNFLGIGVSGILCHLMMRQRLNHI